VIARPVDRRLPDDNPRSNQIVTAWLGARIGRHRRAKRSRFVREA
jgi:hypothetical protein